ncbi:MAG: hypothetical protein GW905_05620 [Rhodobacterales bacterium]|nr:hypothetical protein [Rhodobacterales bacterium]
MAEIAPWARAMTVAYCKPSEWSRKPLFFGPREQFAARLGWPPEFGPVAQHWRLTKDRREDGATKMPYG